MEYTVNKGRQRAPFKAGTLVDVIMRLRNRRGTQLRRKQMIRLDDERVELHGVVAGVGHISDWQIDGVDGDILEYRLHTPETNKEGTE